MYDTHRKLAEGWQTTAGMGQMLSGVTGNQFVWCTVKVKSSLPPPHIVTQPPTSCLFCGELVELCGDQEPKLTELLAGNGAIKGFKALFLGVCTFYSILTLVWQESWTEMLKPNLVCLGMGFRQLWIIHGRVAEIMIRNHLTPDGGVLPPFTQMTCKLKKPTVKYI